MGPKLLKKKCISSHPVHKICQQFVRLYDPDKDLPNWVLAIKHLKGQFVNIGRRSHVILLSWPRTSSLFSYSSQIITSGVELPDLGSLSNHDRLQDGGPEAWRIWVDTTLHNYDIFKHGSPLIWQHDVNSK